MATNKLINFRCPDDLLNAIEAYGRAKYPARPSKRGNIEYDQSKAIRDILISGLETLTDGVVKIEKETIKPKSNDLVIQELLDRVSKLEVQVNSWSRLTLQVLL